jgi:hypothetical protein
VERKEINPPFVQASDTLDKTIPHCHMEQMEKTMNFLR